MGGPRFTPEEDAILKKYAPLKTQAELAQILNRPPGGICSRLKRLGLSTAKHGDAHWNVKVDGLRMQMIHCLLDAGYAPSEVHRMFTTPLDLSYNYITQIACARHRKRG